MDQMISKITVFFALLMVLCYLGKCLYSKVSVNSHVMVGIILKSSGIVIGILLVLSTILPQIKSYLTQVELYLLIAGVSVVVVSVQGIYHDFFGLKEDETPDLPAPEIRKLT